MVQSARFLMEELWLNWSHLGVGNDVKITNIRKLIAIEKEFHRDVLSETRQKLKNMQAQVDKLKAETEELSQYLSISIPIPEFKDEIMLIDYKKQLEEQIIGYREQVEQRRRQIDRLMEWQRDLAEKLGVTISELSEVPLPSEEELTKLKERLEILQAERDKRAEVFLNAQADIKDIMEKLQIKAQNKFEQIVLNSLSVDFKVTDINMDRLAKLHQDLQEKYEQTNNRVLELRERLTRLWECLDEDQLYRENFLRAHPGCTPNVESALREEITRSNIRTKIKLMWDKCMYSTGQREEFVHYYQDIFSEDTLTLHELYLEKITKYYNDHEHIFKLVLTRKNLWLKMRELEARASEPNRYQNRGGQLLMEEKERKTISSKLPKIEDQLRELVKKYEAETENAFIVDGKPLLQLIEDDWETRKQERQNMMSAQQTLTEQSSAEEPGHVATRQRNRTAAGLPTTAERHKPPAKRQLITGSASKAVTLVNNVSPHKRTAMTSARRRVSGRLDIKALNIGQDGVKRRLQYDDVKKTPKVSVNGSILKHKRNEGIHENQCSRSSMANAKQTEIPKIICPVIDERDTPANTPTNTPKKTAKPKTPRSFTPKVEKENLHINAFTPKTGVYTPSRLTRSALKLNNGECFATPRAPLSASKTNLQRQNTYMHTPLAKTPTLTRTNTQTNIIRAKNLPPLI
ncbi:Protein regulator of cytokinesis 1 [Eumeta japonica]|uniref:Protein regulator of cytokinesis 1 n=1 Tax=Eumeta variegata TaxID=151549 RepID=A0A4C1V0H8_EUMVA|nr:Protein regulator of cytokinesis 1 [Eumeta japonica]